MKRMQIHGSHDQMGRSLGQELKTQLTSPPPDQAATDTGKRLIDSLSLYAPELLAELRGIATALNLDWMETAEILAPVLDQGVGCSAFWVSPAHTMDGLPLLGRNWDFRPGAAENAQLIITHPARGYSHLGFTNHPIGRYGGINEAGLTLATAVVPARRKMRGLAFTLATRRILETCAAIEDARDFLETVPHSSSANFLLSDAEGQAVLVEIEPGRVMAKRARNFAAITNHFASIPEHLARPRLPRSRKRRSALNLWFTNNTGVVDAARAREILADREQGVCARGNPGIPHATVTLWSWIARPGSRTVEAAMGSPHCTPYEVYTLCERTMSLPNETSIDTEG